MLRYTEVKHWCGHIHVHLIEAKRWSKCRYEKKCQHCFIVTTVTVIIITIIYGADKCIDMSPLMCPR